MSFHTIGDAGGPRPMAEINTTPLVDVMLVLLVIFIITAPLLRQAVQIDLPRVDSGRLEDKPAALQVAIDAGGRLFLDGVAIGRDGLLARFKLAGRAGAAAPELHLHADRHTRYEQLTDVMALAQGAGMRKIAFVTTQPQAGERTLAALRP
ncbi:MAG: biopolymer transporter ExbD [Burkholderiales bacterium]|nr:biopolymer transporter ExbD [Burkholderiales bacterium]